MKMHTLAALVMLTGVSASAQAQTFYATRDTTLYRFGLGGTVDTFELSDRIVGMTQTADGSIYAISGLEEIGGASKLYEVIDAEGTPSLSLVPSSLSRLYTSITAVGDDLYAFRAGGPGSSVGRMVRIDKDTGNETELANFNSFRGSGGAAYDAASDTMWILGDGENTRLFTIDDYEPVSFGELALTEVGPIGFNSPSVGMEHYRGTLYSVLANLDDGSFSLGRMNKNTGAFVGLRDVDFGITEGALTGLFVLPSPASAVLLGMGGLIATRRRRA